MPKMKPWKKEHHAEEAEAEAAAEATATENSPVTDATASVDAIAAAQESPAPTPAPDSTDLSRNELGTLLRTGMRFAQGFANASPELNAWIKATAEFVGRNRL